MSEYVNRLNAAWLDHLAPRADDAPTVISTFAGCGGSSLGYSMAGYRELLAVEWDDNAVETFRLNFPDVPVYHGDIYALSVEECLRLAGLRPGDLDVLDGSPPCQGFSTAGKRRLDDPRNDLFREYVRLLRGLQPKAFVMENVSGMVKGKMKLVFAEIMRELKASGYVVSARLMNAMYFDVPQSRERMIFVGVRSDLGIVPSHPRAIIRPIAAEQAWTGLVDDGTGGRIYGPHTQIHAVMVNVASGKQHPSHFSKQRLRFDAPSPTISKGCDGDLWHPIEDRVLTFAECRRLASFPDRFKFTGTVRQSWALIGNSVPPLFMRAIAEHLRETVLAPRQEVA